MSMSIQRVTCVITSKFLIHEFLVAPIHQLQLNVHSLTNLIVYLCKSNQYHYQLFKNPKLKYIVEFLLRFEH